MAAAHERMLVKTSTARSDLAIRVEAIRARCGNLSAEEPEGPLKTKRLAERLLASLNRPASEVLRDASEVEVAGSPKHEIVRLLQAAGLPCSYTDYRKKLAALREALDLVTPGWEAQALPDLPV